MQKPQCDFPRGPNLSAVFPLLFTPQLQMPPPLITSNPQRESLKTRRSGSPSYAATPVCNYSAMNAVAFPCPLENSPWPKCTLGLLGLGALCILRLVLVACGCLIDPRQPGALCFLEIRQQTRPPPYPTGPARLTNKHPISNPLVGCWRQTGLYLYPFKPSSGSALPISRVGTSVFLFGGNQT